MMNLIFLIVGVVLGGTAAWFAARLRQSSSKGFSQEDVEQKYVLRTLYIEQRDELNARETTLRDELNARETTLRNELNARTAELQAKVAEHATLSETNRTLNERIGQNNKERDELQKRFQAEFENLANKILEEKSKKFVEANEKHIAGILNPLREKIQTFEKKVEDTYNNETREKASLRKELEMMMSVNKQMSEDAVRLTNALKNDSKKQGNWGEMLLETLLEKSGLERDIHFHKQKHLKTDDGRDVYPDYVINLPEGKNYVIDSKVSLTAYEGYYNADSDEVRMQELKKHVASLQSHINDLGNKNYQNLYGINPPDYVFLFVPIEPALITALQHDRSLFDKALAKNVVPVTTSTLLATLRTVSFIWKQENQKNNVLEIAKESGALYDKFVGFVEDLTTVGSRIEAVQEVYGKAMNKLVEASKEHDSIVGRIERIKRLGAKTTKAIPQKLLDKVKEDGGAKDDGTVVNVPEVK